MSSSKNKDKKLRHAIKILKFVLTLDDDEEIVKSSIESVIEDLEEIVNK